MNDLPCPCCGFLTFATGYGSYDICAVCGWEDDSVQLANPTSDGGANKDSLAQAQCEALLQYPMHQELAKGSHRSLRWRPLTEAELGRANAAKSFQHWHSPGVVAETETYWLDAPTPNAAL
jgi:hypothetical protein